MYNMNNTFGNEIYGTDLATLINKAVDNNEKYKVLKDENGKYIPDDKFSIKITIQMLANDLTYDMETIFNNDVERFIELFNSSRFQSDIVQYHKLTGRIRNIHFIQTKE